MLQNDIHSSKTPYFFKDLHRNSYSLVNFDTFELVNLNFGEVN